MVYHEAATRLGEELARRGLAIVYGGTSNGSMRRLADAALSAGGRVIGVLPQLMDEVKWAHPRLTELRLVNSLHERKRVMLDASDAVVALPGGCGTFEELFEAITWKRLGLHLKPIVLVNINGFFDPCVELLSRCVDEHFLDERHRAMWSVVAQPEAVVDALLAAPAWSSAARQFATGF